ncbi:MAG: hypothetical protein Kow00124_01500 [Anaerolineae bacterium]
MVAGRPDYPWAAAAGALGAGLPLGLGAARLLYEATPMRFAPLGGLLPALAVGAAGAGLWWLLFTVLRRRGSLPLAASIPGVLAWIYVLTPAGTVNPLRGGLLLGGAISLAALFARPEGMSWIDEARALGHRWAEVIPVGIVAAAAYLLTLQRTIGRADTFEFQVVGPSLGIAHPTGYPLYTLLGRLFSLLPLGKIATRVNLTSVVAGTAAVILIYLILRCRLDVGPPAAGIGALIFGLSPLFWSQAVVAEVYALHNALAAAILLVTLGLIEPPDRLTLPSWKNTGGAALAGQVTALFALLGLSLTNHLTTILLLPAAAAGLLLGWPRLRAGRWVLAAGAGAAALLLYLYLPLRWPAVTDGSPMRLDQFAAWVTGSRFGGALQLRAWLTDGTRWAVVGRLLLDQLGVPGIALGIAGLILMARRRWHAALITALIAAAYGFYGLNYLVPDIGVFLLPLIALLAIWGAYAAYVLAIWLAERLPALRLVIHALVLTLLALLALWQGWRGAVQFDWSDEQALEEWGRYVLSLPLDEGSAILADSEKIAPLEYLHRIEGLRPDMEMVVLGTEAEYYEQINARLGAGQTVYLARLLPGLEGAFHLQAVGPLIQVGTAPLPGLPAQVERLPAPAAWQGGIALPGYRIDGAARAGEEARLTLYWQAPPVPVSGSYQVRLRLIDEDGATAWASTPGFPVSGRYPTPAWKPGEIIPDYHAMPLPETLPPGQYSLMVGLAPPFSTEMLPLADGGSWLSLTVLPVEAAQGPLPPLSRRLAVITPEGALTGLETPAQALAGGRMSVVADWQTAGGLRRTADEVVAADGQVQPAGIEGALIEMTLADERLIWTLRGEALRCGWLQPIRASCPVAETRIAGETVAGALANFNNTIVLISAEFAAGDLLPSQVLDVTLEWQGMRRMSEDYTVFVQLLGPDGLLHGQTDMWPVQGTYPTSAWEPGRRVVDRHRVRLDPDAPPGSYRLLVGLYLLGTGERLPVVDPQGAVFDDKITLEGISVPGG